MNNNELLDLLHSYKQGNINEQTVLEKIQNDSFEDIGFAKVDHSRASRQGFPEVIYCAGKTNQQIADIFLDLFNHSEKNIIASRATQENYAAVLEKVPSALYDEAARIIYVRRDNTPVDDKRFILVLTAGTSDIPVAREAGLTAELMGNKVEYCFDVGVAGIHRLLARKT